MFDLGSLLAGRKGPYTRQMAPPPDFPVDYEFVPRWIADQAVESRSFWAKKNLREGSRKVDRAELLERILRSWTIPNRFNFGFVRHRR